MARIILSPGESFTVVDGSNVVTGNTQGRETVTISGGITVFTPDFNAGGDRIVLAGAASQYTVQRSGSSIILDGPNGTRVTIPGPNPNLPEVLNPVISFTTGFYRDFTLDSTAAGVFTLGGAKVSVTPGTVGPTIDPAQSLIGVTAQDTDAGGVVVFTFTLLQAQIRAVSLEIETIGGTAIPGIDFTPGPSVVTFAPGETTRTLTLRTAYTSPGVPEYNTIALRVTSPDRVTVAPDADLVALVTPSNFPGVPGDFVGRPITLGVDVYSDGGSYSGTIVEGQSGKLLSSEDRLIGTGANAIIRLTEPLGRAAVDDGDFYGVINVGRLQTNFTSIRLGAQADRAGLVSLETQQLTDAVNFTDAGLLQGGAFVDLTGDADRDGFADFDNPLNAVLSNSASDTVQLTLQSLQMVTVDTGMTFRQAAGAAVAPIDNIQISGQSNPVRLVFNPVNVGNGTPYDSGTTLAVRAQATDAVGGLIGGGARFDDEGIRFSGAIFTVDDGKTLRAGFGQVILGTGLNDTLTVGSFGRAFVVGGLGNDRITGGAAADVLIGGGGEDVFVFTNPIGSSGAGYDTILDFTYGIDTIELPGGARSITRVSSGALSAATFDADLRTAVGNALDASGAVLFTATGGDLNGATFLVADGNGVAGYQSAEDFVVRLPDAPATLPVTFVV